MAIIVDKTQKRRDIALASRDIILDKGIQNLTISAIARAAGIGKGTFYEYFKSKEELLFELVEILMHAHNARIEARLEQAERTPEKIKIFADFFYDEESGELRELYKMFTGISLLSPQEEMKAFQTECFDYYYAWFEKIIEAGIERGELKPVTRQMTGAIFATAKGMFIISETTERNRDLKHEIHTYVDTLMALLACEGEDA